MANELNDSR